jgi:sugar phosphate isomerase/epimerase
MMNEALMNEKLSPRLPSRRSFIAASGGLLAAIAAPGEATALRAQSNDSGSKPTSPAPRRKIPIGVFDPVFGKLGIDEMLDKISGMGIEAIEIGTGGYPGTSHCPIQELLADPAKLRAWRKKFDDRNIMIATLSCHGNPVSPDAKLAARDNQSFRNSVLLAEKLGVKVIVGFSGCPGGSPTDTTPNWVTYRWPPEFAQAVDWQWSERVIPYWREAAKFAREHGIHRIGLEMHPNQVVYNPRTLIRLREAAGEEIGANCDLSHLFWQGCDPVAVIHFLGKQGTIYHAHMKDTVMFHDNVAKYGVLNFASEVKDLPEASETFRAVGYGHSATIWKDILQAYMDTGYEGILSIENEDPILTGEVGVARAAWVLKNVRNELLGITA